MIESDWSEEHQKIWEALSRCRRFHKPTNHQRAKVIYDILNDNCLLKANEEEVVIANIVLEFLEMENADRLSAELGVSSRIVNRLKSIDVI